MYLSDVGQKRWLQAKLEPIRATPAYTAEDKKRFLTQLTQAETLERYLHTKYVGQKRFSLEGGEALILAMDQLIRTAGTRRRAGNGDRHGPPRPPQRAGEYLGKQPSMLFAEFEGKKKPTCRPATSSTTWAYRPTSARRAARCT
jgi:2-oxoglutarate dehydrogenase E1 component